MRCAAIQSRRLVAHSTAAPLRPAPDPVPVCRSAIGEHVLDAAVVGLDAHQPDAEVEGGVTDQVVHVHSRARVGIEGAEKAYLLNF